MDQGVFVSYQCTSCGEPNETFVDTSGGLRQSYVEDCSICCRPNVLTVTIDPGSRAVTIEAEFEG